MKKITGPICFLSVAAVLSGGHPHIGCLPPGEICTPPAIPQYDAPNREPVPMRTQLTTVVASNSVSTSLIPSLIALRRNKD